jgi:hypothetical protein
MLKNPVTKRQYFAKQPNITNGSKNHVKNCPNFALKKGGHDVTEHFEESGHYVTCDKPSTLKLGWTDRIGGRMSQW